MRMLSIQEAYRRKFDRQSVINGIEYHAAGHCVHIGKLSPGCYRCFVPDPFSVNFHLGTRCNLDCPYCGSGATGKEFSPQEILVLKGELLRKALTVDCDPVVPTVSFTGGGEPLLYIDMIKSLMDFCRDIETYMSKRPWYYLYTNGVLANPDMIQLLSDLGFDELRFHLGASAFSERVYKNMAVAARHIKTITVETPAWPPHREDLFEMLPRIEDLGVKHLNIGEVWLTERNYETLRRLLPDGELYQCFYIHLYDGGLVYDIMEEVLRRGYSFSVLDCSCFVKSIQRNPAKWLMHEPVDGLCAVE